MPKLLDEIKCLYRSKPEIELEKIVEQIKQAAMLGKKQEAFRKKDYTHMKYILEELEGEGFKIVHYGNTVVIYGWANYNI